MTLGQQWFLDFRMSTEEDTLDCPSLRDLLTWGEGGTCPAGDSGSRGGRSQGNAQLLNISFKCSAPMECSAHFPWPPDLQQVLKPS